MNDLTTSQLERQNILNNTIAIKKFQEEFPLKGYYWEEQYWFTKQEIADFFDVDVRTITNYINQNEEELSINGYITLKGKKFKDFKDVFATEINFLPKTTNLSILSFRGLLNLAMLIQNSEKAKEIRSKILDIVIGTLHEKTNGSTKYINQRDNQFLEKSYRESGARKKFTSALNKFVCMNQYKYAYFTDEIYKAIFKENTKEYKEILKLEAKESTRDTMYTEVLNIISSFEEGLAYDIEMAFQKKGNLLTKEETEDLIREYASHPRNNIYIEDARKKMSSRDLCFRDAYHEKLEDYITSVDPEDFEKFLGEKSKSLEKQIEEHREVFLRLKDK